MVKAVVAWESPRETWEFKKKEEKKRKPQVVKDSQTSIVQEEFYELSVTQDVFYKPVRR